MVVTVKYWETRKPNKFEKSRNLTSSLTNYTLNDLYFDRDYFVQVCLCTNKGCSCSDKKFVGQKQSEKGRDFYVPCDFCIVCFNL